MIENGIFRANINWSRIKQEIVKFPFICTIKRYVELLVEGGMNELDALKYVYSKPAEIQTNGRDFWVCFTEHDSRVN